MANLTQVKFYIWRNNYAAPAVTYEPVTFAVYEGTDPNDLGSPVFSDTFTYTGLTDGMWQELTFNMDIDVSNAIFVIEPPHSHQRYPDDGNGVGQICELRQNVSSGASPNGEVYYRNGVLPCPQDNWLGYTEADGAPLQTVYYEYTAGGTTHTTAAGPASEVHLFSIKLMMSTLPGEQIRCSGEDVELSGGHYWTQGSAMTVTIPEPPEKPIDPIPEDEHDGMRPGGSQANIKWTDGGAGEGNAATSYDVYFGTVEAGMELVSEGQANRKWVVPIDYHDDPDIEYLKRNEEYEWRIDAINENGTTEGDEWTFETSPVYFLGKTTEPTPEFEATGISPTVESISWQGGGGQVKYDIYFGTSAETLELVERIDATNQLRFAVESFGAGKLSIAGSAISYWRVDAVNGWGVVTGDVWSFTASELKYPDPTGGAAAGPGLPAGKGGTLTVRRLISAANNKIWYEDV